MKRSDRMKTDFTVDYSDFEIPHSVTSETLKNVFEAAGKQPNTIPLEVLEMKSHRQSRTMHIMAIVTAVLIAGLILAAAGVFFISQRTASSGAQTSAVTLPVHTGDYTENGELIISLSAGSYPIDWQNIYAMTADSQKLKPDAVDDAAGTVSFPLDAGELNIYIPDTSGNVLHLLLSPK